MIQSWCLPLAPGLRHIDLSLFLVFPRNEDKLQELGGTSDRIRPIPCKFFMTPQRRKRSKMTKALPIFILSFALMITPAVAEKPDWAGKGKGAMQAEQTTTKMEEQAEQHKEQMEESAEQEREFAEEQAEQSREQMKERAEKRREKGEVLTKEQEKSSKHQGEKPKGLEKQKTKKSEQMQKELDKGSEQGQKSRENRRKWWKFWRD